MENPAGKRLGDYELLERIGGGGMAEVYRARQLTAFGREVALKIIRPGLSEQEAFRRRFLREAQAISRLSHPHILPLIEFGQEQETLYLVMPLIREGTLRNLLQARNGTLAQEEAFALFGQLCQAVQYAHEQGIIHRDIKPQNILLQQHTHVLLADFGIARDSTTTHLTTTAAGMGTVEYMAPEQAFGQADARSDIYSLGVVLYQMLTGAVPYTGSTPLQVMLKRETEPLPDPRALNPSLSAQVVEVLQTALEKDPRFRFQSAQALGHAVQQIRLAEAPPTQPGVSISLPAGTAQPAGTSQPQASAPSAAPVAGAGSGPSQSSGPASTPITHPALTDTGSNQSMRAGVTRAFSQPDLMSTMPPAWTPTQPGMGAPSAEFRGPAQPAAPARAPTSSGGPFPPIRKRRTGLIATTMVVVALLLVLGSLAATGLAGRGPLGFLGSKPTATATAQATATPTVPAGFKRYVNPDHTFSLIYPANWSATRYIQGTGEQFEGPGSQVVIVTNGGANTPDHASSNADAFCVVYSGHPSPHKTVIISGQQWIQEECDHFTGTAHAVVATIVYKGNLYLLSYAAPKSSFASNNRQYFTPMEHSFTFLV